MRVMKKTIMKKRVVILAVAVALFVAAPASAVLPWDPGDPGSTYQVWEFTDYVTPTGGTGNITSWLAFPEIDGNPYSGILQANIDVTGGSRVGGGFLGEQITVLLKIPNRPEPQPYKEIWVEAGFTGELVNLGVTTFGGDTVCEPIFEAPNIISWQIEPNPDREDIYFTILPNVQTGPQIYLDWVRVDTICIPEPATICLLGLGCLLLRRKRTM